MENDSPAARAQASPRLHYSWVMVGLTFLYSVFSTSALGVPAVLIVPMSQELGWSIGELAAPAPLSCSRASCALRQWPASPW